MARRTLGLCCRVVLKRTFVVFLAGALSLSSCGDSGSESGPVNGSVVWNEGEAPDQITMASAVFFEYPEPGAPDQLIVSITSVETDCDDLLDGVIDNGGWPKRTMVLVTSSNTSGTYEAAITGATGLTFGGSLNLITEEFLDFQDLGVISGTVQIDSLDEAFMEGSLDVDLGDEEGAPPAGRLSGTFRAIACGVWPSDP